MTKTVRLITKDKNFMNTVISIKVVQEDQSSIHIFDRIEEAFGEFDRIVKKYTRFNENSELSNLNRNSGEWVQISDEFIDLIEYMLDLSKQTDGAFDPTIIDFLELYGYDKNYDFSKLDNPDLEKMIDEHAKRRPSWKEIQIDKKNNKVKLAKNQRIDLGGIGKGYAIDCAYRKLESLNNFIIDAGGDIRAKGLNNEGELWNVALKHKNNNDQIEIIGYVKLKDESLACSGSWARKVKNFHHLINPKTGKPQNELRTVYVQAPKALDSDSWATAIFVGGTALQNKIPPYIKYFTLNS